MGEKQPYGASNLSGRLVASGLPYASKPSTWESKTGRLERSLGHDLISSFCQSNKGRRRGPLQLALCTPCITCTVSSVCLCHHHQHGKQTQTRQGSSAKRLFRARKAICSSRRKEWRPSMTPKHTSHKCRPASLRGFSPRRTVPPVWPTPLYCTVPLIGHA